MAMEEEGQPAGDQLAATCFGHWKAKVRAEVMMRGPAVRSRCWPCNSGARCSSVGWRRASASFARRCRACAAADGRRRAHGVADEGHLRAPAWPRGELARTGGELVAIKRSLRWWNLWTVVRLRNRAEDLLARVRLTTGTVACGSPRARAVQRCHATAAARLLRRRGRPRASEACGRACAASCATEPCGAPPKRWHRETERSA